VIINGNTAEVSSAFVKAISEMETLIAEKGKGAYGKYVELGDILKMVRPILAANGLALSQEPMATEDGVGVATTILHSSGATIEFVPLIIPIADRKPHATGSALSYAKRYALAAIFGLEGGVDDDGQEAQDSFKAKATKPPVSNGHHDDELWDTPAAHAKKPDTLSPAQLSRIHILGKDVHGEAWAVEGPKMVREVSNGATSSKQLTSEEAALLIRDLEVKRAQRAAQLGSPLGAASN
jgi:hypothetical protein